jgi:hypothetical protein
MSKDHTTYRWLRFTSVVLVLAVVAGQASLALAATVIVQDGGS